MEIKKASASALILAQACLAGYAANRKLARGGQPNEHAALVGSVCHQALEWFVKEVVMTATYANNARTMEIFVMRAYLEIYDSNIGSAAYRECLKICLSWLERQTFQGYRILSCEVKEFFEIKGLSTGKVIPFNYIMDRFDEIKEDREYRVVDYKSFQMPLSPQELHDKLQARAYALAAQIKYPQAERIWVAFDLLRHDRMVQSAFSREDNIATWKEIKHTVEQVIAADENNLPETVNDGCTFCVRRASCKTLKSNIDAEGIHSFEGIDDLVDTRRDLKNKYKAIEKALGELDSQIMKRLRESQVTSLETPNTKLAIRSRQNRMVDALNIKELVSPEVFNRYVDLSISVTNFESLLADPDVACDPSLVERLQDEIKYVSSGSWIETKPNAKKKGA